MIINDFNVNSITIFKAETYAPLIIDANAPLTFTVMDQGPQPVFTAQGRRSFSSSAGAAWFDESGGLRFSCSFFGNPSILGYRAE